MGRMASSNTLCIFFSEGQDFISFIRGRLIGCIHNIINNPRSILSYCQIQNIQLIVNSLYHPLLYYYSMNNHTLNYVYPPNFEKAHKHRLANRIFKGNLQNSSEDCECCGKKVGEEQVQTSCNIEPSQLSFLGPGIPLFFLFLKFIIFLLLVMSIFFMGFAIYSNVSSNDCGTISSCLPDIFNTLSLINKKSKTDYMQVQSYLGLVFVVICILFFHYFRYKARMLMQECDQVVDSPSDYSIILRRLPKDVKEEEINAIIEEKKKQMEPQDLIKTCNLKVNKIVLSYELKEYNKVKEKNLETFKTCIKEERIDEFKCQELPKPTNTSQIAIVVFESQSSKDYFIHTPTARQKFLQFFCTPCLPLSSFQIQGQKIGIERAPQPDEIYWHNSGVTMNQGICRKLVTGLVSIIVLMVGGGIQYGLSLLSQSVTDSTTQTILTATSSLLVTVFNVILMLALGYLTKKEKNQTETEDQTVLMVKVTLFQFLNAGIFVIISQIAASYTTFSLTKGICSQITLIMILNAIIPNATLLFLQYSEVINKVFRYLVSKKWLIYTQMQLNQIFIGSVIELPNKYAYILKTLWLTALYSPLIPIVIGVSMVGLILFYFVEKFLYTRSYCIPSNVSSMSFQSAVELLEYFLINFSLGELIIYFYFYNFQYQSVPLTWTITILTTVSLAILNSALPMQAINQYLFPISNSSKSELTYTQVEQKFEVTYQMTNPAYQTQRQRNYFKNYIGVPNKQSSKQVVIEMTNVFNDTLNKNNQSLMTQKPLLSDLIQSQSKEEKRESDLAKEEEEEDNDQIQQEQQQQQDGKVKDKQKVKGKQNSKQPQAQNGNKKKKKSKKNKVSKKYSELDGNKKENEQGKLKKKEKNYEQQATPTNKPKKRKYKPEQQQLKVQKKTFQIVDPFQDLSSFKPPTFVIRLRKQQQQIQKQRVLRQKQEEQIAKLRLQQKKLTKPTLQSSINKPPLSPNSNLEIDLQNVYANLHLKPKPTTDTNQNSEMRQNRVHLFVENVAIESKYHKSNGKVNIYEEFIDPNHKSSIPHHFKPRNKIQKQPKNMGKDNQDEEKNAKTPKEKNSKNKFVVVKEVPIRLKKNKKYEESSLPEQKQKQISANLPKAAKSLTNLKGQKEKPINEAYKDAFGKSSNMNSRSSLHNDPPDGKRQDMKQKKTIYDPIALKGSYKRYFKEKFDSDEEENIEGFLDKRVVMSYIGTPFVNLTKNMKTDMPEAPKTNETNGELKPTEIAKKE